MSQQIETHLSLSSSGGTPALRIIKRFSNLPNYAADLENYLDTHTALGQTEYRIEVDSTTGRPSDKAGTVKIISTTGAQRVLAEGAYFIENSPPKA